MAEVFEASSSVEAGEKMLELCELMKVRFEKWKEKGNKSAAKDVRAASLEFEKVAKQFRKLSVAESKA